MGPPAILFTRPRLRIVEQRPYQCKTSQKGCARLPSIYFKVEGLEGMKLTDAMNLLFNGPDDRDDLMFTNGGVGNSVSCRIDVRGFHVSYFHYH